LPRPLQTQLKWQLTDANGDSLLEVNRTLLFIILSPLAKLDTYFNCCSWSTFHFLRFFGLHVN